MGPFLNANLIMSFFCLKPYNKEKNPEQKTDRQTNKQAKTLQWLPIALTVKYELLNLSNKVSKIWLLPSLQPHSPSPLHCVKQPYWPLYLPETLQAVPSDARSILMSSSLSSGLWVIVNCGELQSLSKLCFSIASFPTSSKAHFLLFICRL